MVKVPYPQPTSTKSIVCESIFNADNTKSISKKSFHFVSSGMPLSRTFIFRFHFLVIVHLPLAGGRSLSFVILQLSFVFQPFLFFSCSHISLTLSSPSK